MIRKLFVTFLIVGLAAPTALAESGPASPSPSVPAAAPAEVAVHLSLNDFKATLDQVQSVIQAQARQLENQRRQIEIQAKQIEALRQRLTLIQDESQATDSKVAANLAAASLTSSIRALNVPPSQPTATSGSVQPVAAALERPQQGTGTESADSPLSIHLGNNASLTPGGWVDLTGYFRSTDVGSGLGTAIAAIPFNNTVAGGLSETRLTAQGSRITLRADETFGATKVFGFGEADFNGYLPSNAYVSTNSDSLRLRVYFSDVSRGKWELLAGQSWSLLTPNRVGVSPFLSEIYNTLHLDTSYQAGLTYARQAQLRAVYHFTNNLALGISAENPEQFSGSAVTFPSLFSSSQTDVNSSSGSGGGTSTPTLHPDIIAKLSADAGWAGRKWHFEASGLLTPVAILTPASVTKTTRYSDTHEGGGFQGVANLEVVRNVHLITTGFWSDGGGRYIGGLGPGFVVEQPGSKTSPFLAQLVHSGSGIADIEWRVNKLNVLSFTYSGAYFGRVFSTDPSTGALVGYGFQGSANNNNRAIQEGTIATQQTLWTRPGYGSVQVVTQSSYITRSPWFVAPGAPKDAHVFVGYANLRYVLP